MKKSIKFIKENLLLIILVLQPFLDILAYIQRDFTISWAGYIRLALTVCIPVYALILTDRKKKFTLLMAVIAGFCALHVLNSLRGGFSGIFNDVKYLLLVAHMPILLFSFMFLFDKESIKKQIYIAMMSNILVSVVVFYLSYILNSGNCTYPLFQMGWTGWYVIPNAQSLVLVSLMPFAAYFAIKYCKYFFPIVMAPMIYMYTINGTKAAFGALVLTFVGFVGFSLLDLIISSKRNFFHIYKVVMSVVLIVASLICYNYSPRQIIDSTTEMNRLEEQAEMDELEDEEEKKDKDKNNKDKNNKKDDDKSDNEGKNNMFLQYINPNLVKRFGADRVLKAYGENLNSYGLSNMRLKKLIFGKLTWEDCDFITRLVGFNYTKMQFNDDNFDLENDPHAILYYYGYVGALLYILLLAYFVLRLFKQLITKFKDSFIMFNFVIFLTLVLQVAATFYSGYLLRRPNVSIYLMVVLLLIDCQTEPLFKKNKKEITTEKTEIN